MLSCCSLYDLLWKMMLMMNGYGTQSGKVFSANQRSTTGAAARLHQVTMLIENLLIFCLRECESTITYLFICTIRIHTRRYK